MSQTRIVLPEDRTPERWYNIQADLATPLSPPLHPVTREPMGPDDLAPLFPRALIAQEVSTERWIPIPEPVRDVYRTWRPTPVHRARRLEAALDTPAHIYFKYEGASPVGSHKPNTAVAQAYYAAQEGTRRLATETGAGQWGSALALACGMFGIDLTVFMVNVSFRQKPYRRSVMQLYGARVLASPTDTTEAGRAVRARDPDSPGSLGIAISEAVEVALHDPDTKYALGSVLNHVVLHQTVIGLEAREQMELAGEWPDVVIGCHGGGSNFAGLAFPFLADRLRGDRPGLRVVAAEPASCPTLTRGRRAYDYGDLAGLTPLMAMHTLGHDFVPPAIHAGGLRYHGASPLVSHLVAAGDIEARAYPQSACFEAAALFARTEGIIPAPESSHAIRAAIDEAEAAKEAGEARVVLFNLSGHGFLDMGAYDAWLAGELSDEPYPADALEASMRALPALD